MFIISSLIIALACLYIAILRPVITYIRDVKGFRKYPTQNRLSGVSSLAYCWEVGRPHGHNLFHTRRLHEALMKQPVIRLGPNWLSFGSSRAVKDIYGYNSSCLKGAIYQSLQGGGKHLVNIVDRAEHSHRRRMVATAYAPKNIEAWEPDVADSMARLLTRMDAMCTASPTTTTTPTEESGGPKKEELMFEGMHWSNMFALEAVVKIGLSKDLHFIEAGNDLTDVMDPDGSVRKVSCIDSLHGGSRAASTLIWDTEWFPFFKKVSKLLSARYRANWQRGADWRKIVTKLTVERMDRFKNGEVLDDLFQPMMEDKRGLEPDIHDQDRIAEVDQMINGGADGPAISLANTLYYLVKNPETLVKLRQELDSALSPADHVAPWAKVKNLPYLRACIDESMRLSPPVATDLARRTPPQGTKIDDQMVPGNTVVSISAYTAHRDPEVFPDPEEYRPERWLIKGDDRLKAMLAVYIPFTTGSRGCIGRNVTILMQMVFISTLCHRYEFALPSRDWELTWEDYFNLWPVELPMKIWRREAKVSP